MHRKAVLGFTAALACGLVLVGAPNASADRGAVEGGSSGAGSYAGASDELEAIGLTANQRLVRFDVDRPKSTRAVGRVSGLQGDTALIGIDYRVQNGLLYGVGNAGGIYTINDSNAVATKVSQLGVALQGTNFGVDFNPAADRLRVISDTGQNLRHDVNPGGVTTVDGTLTYPPATTPALGVTGAAYTNNDLDPNTSTTLYDMDTTLDQVAIQSPANSGQLAATGKLTVDAGANAGFDIYSTVADGTTVDVEGYATLRVNGSYRLYEITLFTGRATDMGSFFFFNQVFDLAIPLNQL